MPRFKQIPLSKLVVGFEQTIDPYKLSQHIGVLRRGESLPPACVIKNKNGTYRINDGHHRFVASLCEGKKSLDCVIYEV